MSNAYVSKYRQKLVKIAGSNFSHFLYYGSSLSSLFSSETKQCCYKINSKKNLIQKSLLFFLCISFIQIYSSNSLIEFVPYLLVQITVRNCSLKRKSYFWSNMMMIILDLDFTIMLSIIQASFLFLIINHIIYVMSFHQSWFALKQHLKLIFFEILIASSIKACFTNFVSFFIQSVIILIIFYIIANCSFITSLYYFKMNKPQIFLIASINKMSLTFFVSNSESKVLLGNKKFLSSITKLFNTHSEETIILKNFFLEDKSIIFDTLQYIIHEKRKNWKIKGKITNNILKEKSSIPVFLKLKLFFPIKLKETLIGWMKLESIRITRNKFKSKINEQILDVINQVVNIQNESNFMLNNLTKQYNLELLLIRLKSLTYFYDNKQEFEKETFNLIILILTIINMYIKGSNPLPCKLYYLNKLNFSGKVFASIKLIRILIISIFDLIIILCKKGNIIQIESNLHETLPNDFVILLTFKFDLQVNEIYPFLNKYFKSTFNIKKICKNIQNIPVQYYNELFRFFSIKSLLQAQTNIIFTVEPLFESQVILCVYMPMNRNIDVNNEKKFETFMEIDTFLFESCFWDNKSNYEVRFKNTYDMLYPHPNTYKISSEFCKNFQNTKKMFRKSIPKDQESIETSTNKKENKD